MEKYETIFIESDCEEFGSPSENIPGATSYQGINTKLHYIPKTTPEEFKKIIPILEKELKELENKLVADYKLKDPTNIKVLVIKKVNKALLKYLQNEEILKNEGIIFVGGTPIKKEGTAKYVYSIYGYRTAVVTEKKEGEDIMKNPAEQEIIEALNYKEIKVTRAPLALNISGEGKSNLFYTAVLTDKNNKDVLVYIPVQDILDKKK